MKMLKEDYEILKGLLVGLSEEEKEKQRGIARRKFENDKSGRLTLKGCQMWGIYISASDSFKPQNDGYSFCIYCYEKGLHSNHIETALKKAFKELQIPIGV